MSEYERGVTAGMLMAAKVVEKLKSWHEWNWAIWMQPGHDHNGWAERLMFYERINECRAAINQIELLARAPDYRDEMLNTPGFWEKSAPITPPASAPVPEVPAEESKALQKAKHDQQRDNGNDDALDPGIHRDEVEHDANNDEQHE